MRQNIKDRIPCFPQFLFAFFWPDSANIWRSHGSTRTLPCLVVHGLLELSSCCFLSSSILVKICSAESQLCSRWGREVPTLSMHAACWDSEVWTRGAAQMQGDGGILVCITTDKWKHWAANTCKRGCIKWLWNGLAPNEVVNQIGHILSMDDLAPDGVVSLVLLNLTLQNNLLSWSWSQAWNALHVLHKSSFPIEIGTSCAPFYHLHPLGKVRNRYQSTKLPLTLISFPLSMITSHQGQLC